MAERGRHGHRLAVPSLLQGCWRSVAQGGVSDTFRAPQPPCGSVANSRKMYEALANHVAKVSRKMYEAPEFFYYAIADGLRWLFVCHGRWRGLDCVREKHGDL